MVETDPGVKDKRLLLVESEYASVLRVQARDGNTLSPTIRQAWDCGDLHILTKTKTAEVSGAHVSIVGHITREDLLKYLNSNEQANGYANRFLWIQVKRSKSLPDGGKLYELDLNKVAKALEESVEFASGRGPMERDEKAQKLWCDVHEHLAGEREGLVGAIASRANAQVLRLSLIYAPVGQIPKDL